MANTNHSSELLDVSGKNKTHKYLVNANNKDANESKADISSISSISSIFPSSDKKTFPVETSDILSRVQAFLPQLKTANECLENKDLSELDIENVNDEDGQYIEMNLGLGVYGEKKSEQSDSDDQDENSDNEKLIIPNGTSAGKPEKPLIEVIEK